MAPTKKKKEGVVGETLVSLQREGSSKGTVGSLEKGASEGTYGSLEKLNLLLFQIKYIIIIYLYYL
jgi:hypothetical protein